MKNYYQFVWKIQEYELPLYRFIYSSRLSAEFGFCFSVIRLIRDIFGVMKNILFI